MMKHCFLLSFFLFLISYFLFLTTSTAYGAGEFLSSYNVSYQIGGDGNTIVEQQISLTNQLTTLFPTESEITLGSPNIYNISAYDNIGKIFIRVSKANEDTKVRAVFNEKVVGKGKTYVWHLRYETPDLVSLNGLVKEINIPKLDLNPDIQDYNLAIYHPDSFGQILYVKPDNRKKLFFDKNDLSQSQISLAFGDYQVFNFKLNYTIKNPKITPIYTEIALPPDTSYQKVFLKTLTPLPLDVVLDPDGNWLAKYQLRPEQTITVQATGSAQIFSRPQKQEVLNFNALKSLSSPQKYWESDDEKIKVLAKQLGSAENVYNYLVKFLKYDYNRVVAIPVRLGAKYILDHPEKAICMEFTDLFISLGRALGLSVREVNGFAYTNNSKLKPLSLKKDVLHSWPEYYDESKKAWLQVDPTWGNTSGVDYFEQFDLNHFAFIKRGRNSEYPYPAGAYKVIDGDEAKDVEVTFGNKGDLEKKDKIEMTMTASNQIYAGFSYQAILTIKNMGNTVTDKKVLTLKGNHLEITSEQTAEISPLPPFGQREYKIGFKPIQPSRDASLTAFYNNQNISKEIVVKPLTLIYLVPVLALVFIIAMLVMFLSSKVWKRNV